MDLLKTVYKVAVFHEDYFIISCVFYLFLAMLVVSAFSTYRQRNKVVREDGSLSENGLKRLKVALAKDDIEWELEEKRAYVRELSDGSLSVGSSVEQDGDADGISEEMSIGAGIEETVEASDEAPEEPEFEDSDDFLQIRYVSADVQSIDFNDAGEAKVFPYQVAVNGTVIGKGKDVPFSKGDVIEVNTGVKLKVPHGASVEAYGWEWDNRLTPTKMPCIGDDGILHVIFEWQATTDGTANCDRCIGMIKL